MTAERKNETVRVIFRKFHGEIIALFPDLPGTNEPGTCESYMHAGQHGAANYHHVMRSSRAAAPAEFRPLYRELVASPFGYQLRIVRNKRQSAESEKTEALRALLRFATGNDPDDSRAGNPWGALAVTQAAAVLNLADGKPDTSPYNANCRPAVVLMADLPCIIDEPGDYVTRSGARVTIHEIDSRPEFIARGFAAKGSRWRMFRGKVCPRGGDIWHVSGRWSGNGESARDIVGKFRHES